MLDCGPADVALIDNFDVASMKKAVAVSRRIDISGGMLDTHRGDCCDRRLRLVRRADASAPALDVGLDIEI